MKAENRQLVRHPVAAIYDTVATVKLAVSASRDYRRLSALRRSGNADGTFLPFD